MAATTMRTDAEVSIRRTTAVRRDPVLRGVLIYMAAVAIFFVSGWGGVRAQSIGWWVLQIPVDLALYVLARRVPRLPGVTAPARRFWNAFANGTIFLTIGDISQSVIAPTITPLDAVVPGIIHNVTLVIGVSFSVWAMLTFPTPSGSRHAQVRFWLDGGTVMVAAMVFAWYFSVSPGLVDPSAINLQATLIGVGVELVGAFAIVKLLLTGAADWGRAASVCGASAVGILGFANAATPALLHSQYLNLLLAIQVIALCLLVMSPRLEGLRVRADPQAMSGPNKRPYSLLPYISIAATLALLVAVLAEGLNIRVWGVLIGLVIITALVVTRQLAAFTDNAELLTQLDDKEQLLRSLVQNAADITLISRNGKIAFASPALERVIGMPPAAAIGQPALALVHPDDITELADQLAELEQHREPP